MGDEDIPLVADPTAALPAPAAPLPERPTTRPAIGKVPKSSGTRASCSAQRRVRPHWPKLTAAAAAAVAVLSRARDFLPQLESANADLQRVSSAPPGPAAPLRKRPAALSQRIAAEGKDKFVVDGERSADGKGQVVEMVRAARANDPFASASSLHGDGVGVGRHRTFRWVSTTCTERRRAPKGASAHTAAVQVLRAALIALGAGRLLQSLRRKNLLRRSPTVNKLPPVSLRVHYESGRSRFQAAVYPVLHCVCSSLFSFCVNLSRHGLRTDSRPHAVQLGEQNHTRTAPPPFRIGRARAARACAAAATQH